MRGWWKCRLIYILAFSLGNSALEVRNIFFTTLKIRYLKFSQNCVLLLEFLNLFFREVKEFHPQISCISYQLFLWKEYFKIRILSLCGHHHKNAFICALIFLIFSSHLFVHFFCFCFRATPVMFWGLLLILKYELPLEELRGHYGRLDPMWFGCARPWAYPLYYSSNPICLLLTINLA